MHYDPSRRGNSVLTISIVPKDDTEATITGINDVIDETLEKTIISEDRIAVAKKSLLADAVYARDGYMGAAMLVGEALTLGLDIDLVEKWPESISAITLEDVTKSLSNLANRQTHVTGLLKAKQQ